MSIAAEPLIAANQHAGPSGPSHRSTLICTMLACASALVAISIPMFLGHVYVADDLGEFHLPIRAFYAEQLAAGESWDWMPGLFGGFYLTGEGQLGGYHPLHLLLYSTLPLGVAFNLELLFSYPALLVGSYLLLRRLVGNSTAALFGAACFTFGGFNLLHFVHPNAIAVVAHIPWLLWLADRLVVSACKRESLALAAVIALLTGSQILLGYPQYVWFSLLAEGSFIAVRLSSTSRALPPAGLLVAAKLLGLCLGAVQILPTVEALGESTRIAASDEFSATGSLHPLNVVQLFAPYLFQHRVVGQNTHELGMYFGAVPCVLCCWLLLQTKAWGEDRRTILMLVVALLAALLLAFGQFAPLYQLQQQLPLVGHFRFPCRAIVLVQFVLMALSAVALKRLVLERTDDTPRSIWFPALLPLTVSVILAIASPLIWPHHLADIAFILIGPALFAIAVALIVTAQRSSRLALQALIVFAIADVVAYGAGHSILGRTSPLASFVAGAPSPPQFDDSRVIADVSIDAQPLEVGNRMLLSGTRRLDGYAGLEPCRSLQYSDRNQLRLAGVGWIYSNHPTQRWTRLPEPLPQARLVTRTKIGDDFRSWHSNDFDDCALVSTGLELSPDAPGKVDVTHDQPGQIDLTSQTSTAQLLVVAESYHGFWQATVDDLPVPVLRVNQDFLGCVVPAGTHAVRLRFSPLSLRLGKAISAGGLGLCVTAIVLAWAPWPRRNTRRPQHTHSAA